MVLPQSAVERLAEHPRDRAHERPPPVVGVEQDGSLDGDDRREGVGHERGAGAVEDLPPQSVLGDRAGVHRGGLRRQLRALDELDLAESCDEQAEE